MAYLAASNGITLLTTLLLSSLLSAQEPVDNRADNSEFIDLRTRVEEVKNEPRRELTVLAPTLTPEEIDPAILNRLLREIAQEPELVKVRLSVDDGALQDIFIALSNARNFINTNEMANIRAMCQSWNQSILSGEEQIDEALQAYERRAGFTKSFIARFYRIVLDDIKHSLSEPALLSLDNYMADRRRRMATAGTVTTGIPTQNTRSGAEAVLFHCGQSRKHDEGTARDLQLF